MGSSVHGLAVLPLVLALSCLATASHRACRGCPPIVGLRVGFDSRYKLGHWTPVEVTFWAAPRRSPARSV